MYICLLNPYGNDSGMKIWYRKQGDNCFDFVSSKEFASSLTKEDRKNGKGNSGMYLQNLRKSLHSN